MSHSSNTQSQITGMDYPAAVESANDSNFIEGIEPSSSKEDCAIIELLPDRYMTPLFKKLAMDCNHRYSPILGQLTENKDAANNEMRWKIDIGKLAAVLDDMSE